jgi:cytochrome c oxidase subunit 5a
LISQRHIFYRPDIDGWEIRKAMGDLAGMDLVPEPVIVAAALRACRRINDYSLTTRFVKLISNNELYLSLSIGLLF